MKAINSLLELTVSLALLVVLAGMIAAPLTGSDKSFELAPVLSLLKQFGSRVMWAASPQPPDDDPEPFLSLAKERVDQAQEYLQEQHVGDIIQSDPRLAICPEGSIDDQPIISTAQAQEFKTEVESGAKILDVADVQARLGQPNCNATDLDGNVWWRYLVEGGAIIDARQTTSDLKLSFTNF